MSVLRAYLEGQAQAAPMQSPRQNPMAEYMSGNEAMSAIQDAFAAVESDGSGGYAAVGPETGKGRAYGRYQVMDFNIGPWTREVLGQELTPEQFLTNPQAQDAVFSAKIGGYMDEYGSLEDAASMWFSGRPYAGNTRSDGYLSVPQYVSKVRANYNPMERAVR